MRTCVYYFVACVVLLSVAQLLFPGLREEGDQGLRALAALAVLGLPVTAVLSWYYQLTPRGIVRTTSFVERRVLRNMAPINDQRHSANADQYQKDSGGGYRWVIAAETGPLTGLSFGVARPIVMGRSLECDIAVVSHHLSLQHARLDPSDGRLTIEDLNSSSGVVVNGKRIQGPTTLSDDDEIRFHDVIFRVSEVTPDPAHSLEPEQELALG